MEVVLDKKDETIQALSSALSVLAGGQSANGRGMDALMAKMKQIGANVQVGQKAGLAAGVSVTPYMTGPAGLFGVTGLERDVISSRTKPRGLAGTIPAKGTNVTNPLFPYITGFQNGSGSQPNGVCDDPPTAGALKTCITSAQFGIYSYKTREVNIKRLGQIINRGEFQDLNLVNDLFNTDNGMGGLLVPDSIPVGQLNLYNELAVRMIELGNEFQEKLARQIWEGNPINNTSGGGYAEFPGLNSQIITGHVDVQTNATCPSIDSYLDSFNFENVSGTNGESQDYISKITYAIRYLNHNAITMGFDPVQFTFVMREELFYELAAAWACSYETYRCNNSNLALTQAELFVNASDVVELRDAMRQGQFLLVDGKHYPVIFDDGIREHNSQSNTNIPTTGFSSDMYILPLSVRGGSLASLYWEYYDWAGPNAAISALSSMGGPVTPWYWTDGGRFLWHDLLPVNWCISREAVIEPRLILRVPQLAARLSNAVYNPLVHTREPFRDDYYFVDGGQTDARPGPSLYEPWDTSTPFPTY